MKPGTVLGMLLLASCTATFAGTTDVPNAAKIKADQLCEAVSGDAATEATVSTSAGADLGKPDFNPHPAEILGGGNCPNDNTCSCGVPTFNPEDPACVPGIDLGLTHCRSLHCPDGQTVHYRVCPCTATGCSTTWSALFCTTP